MTALSALPALLVLLSACGKDDAAVPFAEVRDQGADRYLGSFEPATSEPDPDDASVINHAFDPLAGPMCMLGGTYRTMTRDQGSDDLLIFLQGGGMCTSDLCLAVTTAPAGIPPLDVLDPAKSTNPFRDWSTVYAPYCDGSLFAGDVELDTDGDGEADRFQYGLKNLSATLDLASATFPEPRRVMLAGSSGGGYGTLIAVMLTRWTYPDAELLVFNDAGVGLGIEGEPDFLRDILDEFQARDLIPASQESIIDGGHLTPLLSWQLDEDPDLRIAAFSAYEDYVISQMYLEVDGDDFSGWLEDELEAVHDQHPDRFQSFLVDGFIHTTLLGTPEGFIEGSSEELDALNELLGDIDSTEVDGVNIAAWTEAMLSGSQDWVSLSD